MYLFGIVCVHRVVRIRLCVAPIVGRERAVHAWRPSTYSRQHNEEMYKKVMISVYKQGDATFRSAAVLSRELSLCIRPSSPRPPAGGPGSPELALDDLEARNTFPSAACSMSQESYGTIRQVSQPTTVPKNTFQPGEKR